MAQPVSFKGIILRKTKYGESDLILAVLKQDGAQISVIAKSALRSKKRFGGGVLDPLNYCEFQTLRSDKEMLPLSEAKLISDFSGLRLDYDRLQTAFEICEVSLRASQVADVGNAGLFNLVGNTLRVLETENRYKMILVYFYLKLLAQQGILDLEDWMKPYSGISIKDIALIQEDGSTNQHLIYVREQWKTYTR